MNLVAPGPAFVAGLFLFLVPGLVFLALLGRRDREEVLLDEALFLAVSVSAAAAAWVALLLAEAGAFSLTTAAGILAAASGAALLAGRHRLSRPLPGPRRWRDLLPALAVLGLALGLQARPSEYLMGGRDPGTYIAAMGVIARTGGIVYTDPGVLSIPREDVELFYRHPEKADFSWGRFMGFPLESPASGRVYPEFFHLFPAFGAYLFQAMGVKGALATPPVFGVLGTMGVFFCFRRVFGPAPALLASLLLALNVVQVWFARYPVSEPLSQFLIFLGLLAFSHWEERGSRPFAVLAGAALGLSLLVRIDSVLILLPVGLYVLIRRARGDLPWREALPLLAPFCLLALHALVHAAFWSRKYVLSIASRPYWHQRPEVWAGGAIVLVAVLVLTHRWGPLIVKKASAHARTFRPGLVGLVVLLALYAYFLRPSLSAWAGADGNDPTRALGEAGWLRTLGFHRLAAHDAQAFLRLGWWLTPAGLGLGVAGLVMMIREWRGRYLFPVLVALSFGLFYFYKIRIYNDYFFALRRFMPVVVPFLLGFAALLLATLMSRPGARRALAAALALILGAAYLKQTVPILGHREWRNAVRFVADVARRFGPDDVVIFEQPQSIHLLSLPLWAVHGVNVLELARFNPDPARLQHLVGAWRDRYRNIYFVHTYRTRLCELFLQRVEDHSFGTFEWERAYGRPPAGPEFKALRFTVSRVVPPGDLRVPPLPEVDIGGSDDFQVSGFFDKEGWGDRTYRWTGPCASVYLPGARPGALLVVTASTGRRPGSPAPVRVSLSGTPLGGFSAGAAWEDHVLSLPEPLPPGPPVLRMEVPPFRPANVFPGSDDVRDLGVMVDRIGVGREPRDKLIICRRGGGGS